MNNKEKKDKLIDSVFDEYTDGINPPPELLQPAAMLLHAQNTKKRWKKSAAKRPFKKRVMAFAALGIAAVMLLSYMIYSFMGVINNRTKYYYLNELSSISISETEMNIIKTNAGIDRDLFPKFEGDYDAKYTLFYFTETNVLAYIVCKSRYISAGGNTDVKITAEFTKDVLNDFKSYYNLPESTIGKTTVKHNEKYEGGEYVTTAMLKHNNIKYYLDFMSPSSVSIDVYAELIISL